MKRFFLAVLAAWSLTVCSGCAVRSGPAGEPAGESLTVVGMCQVGAESDWRAANTESMKAVFTEENGYHLLFEDARQKQENQNQRHPKVHPAAGGLYCPHAHQRKRLGLGAPGGEGGGYPGDPGGPRGGRGG